MDLELAGQTHGAGREHGRGSPASLGWHRIGVTLSHAAGSLKAAALVAAAYSAFFVLIALLFPAEPASAEDLAFQLTMPGLEEELFYRGVLLFVLDQAFQERRRLLGVG